MNLYLIENDRTIDRILSSGDYHPGKDVIICFNYLVTLRLKKEKAAHVFKFVEEMLTAEDYNMLHSASDRFATGWYRPRGRDLTLYYGVSYGDLCRTNFTRIYMTHILVKYGEVIRKAIEEWPETAAIYYDFSNDQNSFHLWVDESGKLFDKQKLVEEVARQLKRKVSRLIPDAYIPSIVKNRKPAPVPLSLKRQARRFFDTAANAVRSRFVGVKNSHGRIYLCRYGNIDSMIRHISHRFILSNANFDLSMLSNAKNFIRTIVFRFKEIPYEMRDGDKKFLQSLRAHFTGKGSSEFGDFSFILNGIDYAAIVRPAIEDLVLHVIPDLLIDVMRVEKAIRKYNIGKIVVNEEVNEEFQAMLAACAKTGIGSVWVDHGIQGSRDAMRVFDREKSDIVITPGEYSIDFYKGQGKGSRVCVALGNPSTDPYAISRSKKISAIKRVLFMSFSDSVMGRLDRYAYQEKFYAEILPVFKDISDMGVSIYFKPHPAHRREYFDYLFNYFSVDLSRIEYIEGMKFSRVIRDMDLVVSNVSSCFFESQAAGVPTIFFEPHFIPDALLKPYSGIHEKEVLRIGTGKELVEMIKTNKDNPAYLNNFLDNFLDKYAGPYMGKLDGMAGKRIVEYLEKD